LYRYAEYHAETARWFDELSKRQEPVVRGAAQELQALCDADEFLKSACEKVEVQPRAKEFYGVFRKAGGAMGKLAVGSAGGAAEAGGGGNGGAQRNGGAKEGAAAAGGGDIERSLRRVNEVAQLRVVLHLKDPTSKLLASRVCYHGGAAV
jgi:GTP pyrophosphokinase